MPHRMTASAGGPRPDPRRLEALAEVLEQEAARARYRPPPARAERRHGRLLAALILLGLSLWLLLFPPAWLSSAPPQQPVEQEAASLRLIVYLQARRIEAYRREHGRLPVDLEEAGPSWELVRYQPRAGGGYTLQASGDRGTVVYDSGEPLEPWAADAFRHIRGGGR